MNDLDLVREMRADTPAPDRARLALGRDRLAAAAAGPSRPRLGLVSRLPGRAVLAVGVVVAAAIGVVAYSQSDGAISPKAGAISPKAGAVSPKASVSAGRSHPAQAPARQLTTVVQILDAAAKAVAARPAAEPGARQWIYTKSIGVSTGQPTTQDQEWTTFDGTRSAYFQGRQLVLHTSPIPGAAGSGLAAYDQDPTPLTAYNGLASLPTDPQALLAAVKAELAANPGIMADFSNGTLPSEEFAYLRTLLWNAYAAAPPSAEAAVFRAMATIPGVQVYRGRTDAAGQPVVGIGFPYKHNLTELLLDPATYRVLGQRQVEPAPEVPGSTASESGTTVDSIAYIDIARVPGPGHVPGE